MATCCFPPRAPPLLEAERKAASVRVDAICPGVALVTKPKFVIKKETVRTSLGPVQGFQQSRGATAGSAVHFRGIPFAATTFGANRFKPPQPREPWTQLLDCTVYRAECREPVGAVRKMMKSYGKKVSETFATGAVGDDCLNLNVVTPSLSGKAPTMVWIHGGANVMSGGNGSGMAFAPTCSEIFAKEGAVVVSIHYRQGIHGFAHFPKLGVTNLMLRDVIASLEWVQREIHRFGGDPSNVTVFGESAGAIAIACLLACKPAQHLFHRAILQSGGLSAMPVQDYETVVQPDFEAALMPFVKKNGHSELTRAALDSLSGKQMAAARLKNTLLKNGVLMSPSDFHHVLGDDLLPADPYGAIADGLSAHKQVLVMSTAQECDMMQFAMPCGSVLLPLAANFIGPMALRGVGFEKFTAATVPPKEAVSAFWKELVAGFEAIVVRRRSVVEPKGAGKIRALNFLFGTCGIATAKLVDALRAAPAAEAVYTSMLECSEDESPKLRNGHTLDLFLLFRNDTPAYDRYMAEMLRGQPAFGAPLDKLCANMVRAWVRFASEGAPGDFDGVEWPMMPSKMVMRSSHSEVEHSDLADDSEEMLLWTELCAKYDIRTVSQSARAALASTVDYPRGDVHASI